MSNKKMANTEFQKPLEKPQPYSNLSDYFFVRVGNDFGQLLPVYAVGHNNPLVRRLASELFEALFVNRKTNDT
jgi:hypothetical protein